MAAIRGELTAKDEQEIKKAEHELAAMPGFKSARYLDAAVKAALETPFRVLLPHQMRG